MSQNYKTKCLQLQDNTFYLYKSEGIEETKWHKAIKKLIKKKLKQDRVGRKGKHPIEIFLIFITRWNKPKIHIWYCNGENISLRV